MILIERIKAQPISGSDHRVSNDRGGWTAPVLQRNPPDPLAKIPAADEIGGVGIEGAPCLRPSQTQMKTRWIRNLVPAVALVRREIKSNWIAIGLDAGAGISDHRPIRSNLDAPAK